MIAVDAIFVRRVIDLGPSRDRIEDRVEPHLPLEAKAGASGLKAFHCWPSSEAVQRKFPAMAAAERLLRRLFFRAAPP
jgi:hypothetical protein